MLIMWSAAGCALFTGRSTEVEDMMASSEDKNATEDLNRDFHIQEQRYDSQWTEDEFGDLLIRRPQHAGHWTVPAPKFMLQSRGPPRTLITWSSLTQWSLSMVAVSLGPSTVLEREPRSIRLEVCTETGSPTTAGGRGRFRTGLIFGLTRVSTVF